MNYENLPEIVAAVEAIKKNNAEIIEKLVENYLQIKDDLNTTLKSLPTFLQQKIQMHIDEDPTFILVSFGPWMFAATDAKRLAGHFNTQTEWQDFLKQPKPDFSKVGGLSQGHTQETFALTLAIANDIVSNEHPLQLVKSL